MKKIILLCACMFMLILPALSQDSNDVFDVRTADIQLVSGFTITAPIIDMKSDYVSCILNGKTEVIPASQIVKVTLLVNGQVREYNDSKASAPEEASPTNITSTSVTSDATATSAAKSGRIYRDNGHYLHNDIYISSKEVERILMREDAAAYNEWKKADGLLIGGSVFAGIGGGLAIGGLFTLISHNYIACLGIECGALVSLGVGLGLSLSSSAHYSKAIDIYNSKYDQAAVQLQWHVAPTEVGLAFVF